MLAYVPGSLRPRANLERRSGLREDRLFGGGGFARKNFVSMRISAELPDNFPMRIGKIKKALEKFFVTVRRVLAKG
jgi:hypothetical protein